MRADIAQANSTIEVGSGTSREDASVGDGPVNCRCQSRKSLFLCDYSVAAVTHPMAIVVGSKQH